MSNAEVRGRNRLIRALVRERADLVERTVYGGSLEDDLVSAVHRGSAVGRARAARRLRAALPGTFGWQTIPSGGLVGAYLAVSGPVIQHPRDWGQHQDAVVVRYVVLGSTAIATGLWTLEVPEHALARTITRDPRGDALAKVGEAHAVIASAARFDHAGEFLVPTTAGVFVAEWMRGLDNSSGYRPLIYARARTWLHEDMLVADQSHPVLEADPSGDIKLEPPPLRRNFYDDAVDRLCRSVPVGRP